MISGHRRIMGKGKKILRTFTGSKRGGIFIGGGALLKYLRYAKVGETF